MTETTKLLLAYDGSAGSEAMLEDLQRAGLPAQAEVRIVTVAEMWLAPTVTGGLEINTVPHSITGVHSAEGIAQRAAATLQQAFPGWQVQTVAASGSACGILLEQTDEWRPALLVVGSHGHSMLRRVFVGSVSLKMAMEAPCSVRVARGRAKTNGGPLRLLIGVDGSPGAEATVGAVAARRWPPGTEARVVNAVWKIPAAAAQQVEFHELPTQQLVEQVAAENERLHEKVAYSVSKLQAAGLVTSSVMQEADPKRLLLDEAERWQADCIFVGASGHSRFQRLWLGSVSTAVVTRAACSVEIVR